MKTCAITGAAMGRCKRWTCHALHAFQPRLEIVVGIPVARSTCKIIVAVACMHHLSGRELGANAYQIHHSCADNVEGRSALNTILMLFQNTTVIASDWQLLAELI